MLNGEGHSYLWTKNALERSGYRISDQADKVISVSKINDHLQWRYGEQSFGTLNNLLQQLQSLSAD
jgi:iron complex transport system ATP-binding protein